MEYRNWPRIIDLCAESPSNGLMEKRGGALIDIDQNALEQRMRAYFNSELSWEAYRLATNVLTQDRARFDAAKARAKAIEAEQFQENRLVRYALRPFDTRWCYYTGIRPVWNEPRPTLWKQLFSGNAFLLTRFRSTAVPEGFPVSYTRLLSDDHYMTPDGVAVPFELPDPASAKKKGPKNKDQNQLSAFAHEPEPVSSAAIANVSPTANEWASKIGVSDFHKAIWHHVLAICYSLAYLRENADGVQQDWPRIPLPSSEAVLEASSALGSRVAALLDTENPVDYVTTGSLASELKLIGQLLKVDGKPVNEAEDLKITAGWGHAGKDGVTMPGRGKLVQRDRTKSEMSSLIGGQSKVSEASVSKVLGSATYDVYLNDVCIWKNIPEKVWELYIGGYQVIKKWLSYREFGFIGRPLTTNEASEVTAMARRLTALCLMQPELDANYLRIKAAAYSWPMPSSEEKSVAVAVDKES